VLWVVVPGIGGGGAGLALPAGVGLERGGSEGFEPGEQLAQPPVVVDPGPVVVVLAGAEPAADGLGGDLAGPLPVRAVQPGGPAWQAQVRWPQRMCRRVIEPGRTMPEAAMAASSAAIWRAWSWWLAATCTVSGWHRPVTPVMSYGMYTV